MERERRLLWLIKWSTERGRDVQRGWDTKWDVEINRKGGLWQDRVTKFQREKDRENVRKRERCCHCERLRYKGWGETGIGKMWRNSSEDGGVAQTELQGEGLESEGLHWSRDHSEYPLSLTHRPLTLSVKAPPVYLCIKMNDKDTWTFINIFLSGYSSCPRIPHGKTIHSLHRQSFQRNSPWKRERENKVKFD